MTAAPRGPYRVAERHGKLWRPRLQEARVKAGLTLKQAADKLSISVPYLNFLEHGTRDPSLTIAHRIAKLYGETIDGLWLEPLT